MNSNNTLIYHNCLILPSTHWQLPLLWIAYVGTEDIIPCILHVHVCSRRWIVHFGFLLIPEKDLHLMVLYINNLHRMLREVKSACWDVMNNDNVHELPWQQSHCCFSASPSCRNPTLVICQCQIQQNSSLSNLRWQIYDPTMLICKTGFDIISFTLSSLQWDLSWVIGIIVENIEQVARHSWYGELTSLFVQNNHDK